MDAFILLGALLAVLSAAPLAWKWRLGVSRTVATILLLALGSGAVVVFFDMRLTPAPTVRAGLVWLFTMLAAFAILAYRFYRDPERNIPEGDGLIVSPADGEVLYIRHSIEGSLPVVTKDGRHYALRELTRTTLPSNNAVVIGIGMSFLDVHVNRAPIGGRITLLRRFPGLFGSLRLPEMVFQNERVTTVIQGNDLQVAVVQIASRLVRQIRSFVCESQDVSLGQRIGAIRLGSQVDLVLPDRRDIHVLVQPGERVWAGQSVVAQSRRNSGAAVGLTDPAARAGREDCAPG